MKNQGKFCYCNKYFIDNKYNRDENEKVNAIDLIEKLLKINIGERISIKEALMYKFFESMNDANDDTIKYYKEIITRDRLEEKYEMIKIFKFCVICNKRYINEILKECKKCANSYYSRCIKVKKACTCVLDIPEYEFMKIINTQLLINKYINNKYGINKQICLKLSSFEGEKYSIMNFLNKKTFSNELIYECDQSLNYYLIKYKIFELNDINKKI